MILIRSDSSLLIAFYVNCLIYYAMQSKYYLSLKIVVQLNLNTLDRLDDKIIIKGPSSIAWMKNRGRFESPQIHK